MKTKATFEFCSAIETDLKRTWYYTTQNDMIVFGSGSWDYNLALTRFREILHQAKRKPFVKVLDSIEIEIEGL